MEHAGKHALVTGGGTGIGAGIALALAQAGAEVTITGRRADKLAEVAGQHDSLHSLVMDVDDEASIRSGIAQAAAERGPIQICVANAGITEGGPFAKTTLAQWRKMMTTNLDGVFLTFQAAMATLPGSLASSAPGRPVRTLQKAQARVQTSPRIITVACFLVQHSPILGHAASSHTVFKLSSRIRRRVSLKPSPIGAFTLIQSGLRSLTGRSGKTIGAFMMFE